MDLLTIMFLNPYGQSETYKSLLNRPNQKSQNPKPLNRKPLSPKSKTLSPKPKTQSPDVGGSQNYGPFLDPYYNTAPIII